MRETYKWATLGLGTLITVAVSLACSYWFFYSLMGSTGYQAVGAGIAGCAIQLFGYGFAAKFLPLKTSARVILCSVPLALSMFSTYSALYGYLSKEKEVEHLATKEQQLIVNILEQSAQDKQIAASAAQQGVSEAYRTQAKGFLQFNDESRDKDERLLDRLSEHKEETAQASPLDGLVRVTGDSELTTIIFCAWLAIMFDILPVIAISVMSHRREGQIVVEVPHAEKPATVATKVKATVSSAVVQNENSIEETILEKADTSNKINRSDDTVSAELPEMTYDQVISSLKTEAVEPNYKAVRELTGWSQWKAQEFFKHCQEQNILEKEGRTFKLITNVMPIGGVKKAAYA
ncbi:MAG: hypothetical protein G8D89_16410 [gamma proteobacterium symbiont of Clathrolucina costata]